MSCPIPVSARLEERYMWLRELEEMPKTCQDGTIQGIVARATLLQESTFGVTSKDYRIDDQGEFYITNFKTLRTPSQYRVEIYRGQYMIGTFSFATQRYQWKPGLTIHTLSFPNSSIIVF